MRKCLQARSGEVAVFLLATRQVPSARIEGSEAATRSVDVAAFGAASKVPGGTTSCEFGPATERTSKRP